MPRNFFARLVNVVAKPRIKADIENKPDRENINFLRHKQCYAADASGVDV